MINLQLLSKEDYNLTEVPILFEAEGGASKYAILKNQNTGFKLSWQSDLIEPQICEIFPELFSIGIDLRFALISIKDIEPKLVIKLNYFFYSCSILNNSIYVFTELSYIKIDLFSLKVIGDFGLPEYFQEVIIVDNTFKIKCLDNNIYDLY